jgi:hypothetical protein
MATLRLPSEIGADENKEPKPWLPIMPFDRGSFLTRFQTLRMGRLFPLLIVIAVSVA